MRATWPWIKGDEIDFGGNTFQHLHQIFRVLDRIIHAFEHNIFKGDAASVREAGVISASIHKLGNGVFFNYIIQISSLSGFLVWLGIALSHYQFRKKYLVAKNIAIEQLSYRSKLFPSATVASIFIILTVIIGQVFTLDASKRDMYSLFITYFSLLIFLSIYLIHKVFALFNRRIEK